MHDTGTDSSAEATRIVIDPLSRSFRGHWDSTGPTGAHRADESRHVQTMRVPTVPSGPATVVQRRPQARKVILDKPEDTGFLLRPARPRHRKTYYNEITSWFLQSLLGVFYAVALVVLGILAAKGVIIVYEVVFENAQRS